MLYLVAIPFYIPTNSVEALQFLHILIHTYYLYFISLWIIFILTVVRWYSIIISSHISQVIYYIEHLFIYLLDICMPKSEFNAISIKRQWHFYTNRKTILICLWEHKRPRIAKANLRKKNGEVRHHISWFQTYITKLY